MLVTQCENPTGDSKVDWPKEANKHKEEYWVFPKIGVGPLQKWMVFISWKKKLFFNG